MGEPPVRPHLLGVSQISLSDEDMKLVDSMTDIGDIMDFMDERKIPYENLDSVEEFKNRIWLEYYRQRRGSPKQVVSFLLLYILLLIPEAPVTACKRRQCIFFPRK